MSKDTGGPAFPAEGGCDSELHAAPGMTLRDFFAASALSGVMAGHTPGRGDLYWQSHAAWDAYSVADAMLAERAKEGGA